MLEASSSSSRAVAGSGRPLGPRAAVAMGMTGHMPALSDEEYASINSSLLSELIRRPVHAFSKPVKKKRAHCARTRLLFTKVVCK